MAEPRAIQLDIEDTQLQAYLQRNPWSTGPDPALNKYSRNAVAVSFKFRDPAPPATTILLNSTDTTLPQEEASRALELCRRIGISEGKQKIYFNDFAWEANMVPRTATNVLVMGCGDGIELLFLRAVLPHARITALDYHEVLLPGLQQAVQVDFKAGDMNKLLQSLNREFDLVYSNHVMEHFYTPDKMLAMIAGLVVPGGTLLSALPVVGKEGVPYLETVHKCALGVKPHPLDTTKLDPGHPWKTHPGDLKQTLERVGFDGVEIFQRADQVSRSTPLEHERFAKKRHRRSLSNTVLCGPVRATLKGIFGANPPEKVLKYYFAADRRMFCGTNRLMNDFAEEVLVRCVRS